MADEQQPTAANLRELALRLKREAMQEVVQVFPGHLRKECAECGSTGAGSPAASSDGKPVPVESLLDKDDFAVIAEENARSTGSKDDPAARIGIENGTGECVDICGGKVSDYADYYPPKEQT